MQKIIYPTRIAHLKIIPAGTNPPNPADLLASEKMANLISRLERTRDLIIYDSSPILATTESMLLASRIRDVLLVIKYGSTNWKLVSNAVNRLKSVGNAFTGGLLNGVNLNHRYGYYHYYHHYYYDSYSSAGERD